MKLHNQVLLDLVMLSSEFLYIRLHCYHMLDIYHVIIGSSERFSL